MGKNKGITLIALVITIIVLLILAGVTIATLTGDNGLLQKATSSKQANEDSKELELIKLAVSAAQLEGKGTLTTQNLNDELEKNFGKNKIAIEKNGGWLFSGNIEYTIYNDGIVELGNKLLLPPEYQQVEYIKSTGTQYIDTSILSTNAKIEITFIFNESINKSQVLVNCVGDTTGWLGLTSNGRITLMGNDFDLEYNQKHSFTIEYKNGKTTAIDENNNSKYRNCTPNTNFTIFAATNRAYPCYVSVYKVKIYDDDELVRDFIPCYNIESEKVGLYDTVENRFFTDVNGGNFEAGPEV